VLQPTFSAANFTGDAHRHFERNWRGRYPEPLHEFGHRRPPERERPISPKVQQLLDSARQLQEERIKRARTEERLDLITEALREENPSPAPVQGQGPRNFMTDPFGIHSDRLGQLERAYDQFVAAQREADEQHRFGTMLAEAARYQPDVNTAYQAIAVSRIADMLGERYPQATHDQLLNAAAAAMRQNQVPPDIHSAFADEMRHFFRRAGGQCCSKWRIRRSRNGTATAIGSRRRGEVVRLDWRTVSIPRNNH
jgi:hypothetical protein